MVMSDRCPEPWRTNNQMFSTPTPPTKNELSWCGCRCVWISLPRCDLKLIILLFFFFYIYFIGFLHTSVESPPDLESMCAEWLQVIFKYYWCFYRHKAIFRQMLSKAIYLSSRISLAYTAECLPETKNDPSVCRENLLTLHKTNLISL